MALTKLDLSLINGLGTAASLDIGTGANQILQLDGAGKLPAVDISQGTGLTSGQLPTHTHPASSITGTLPASSISGTVSLSQIGTGTADASTFLRGDGTWQAMSTISSSGSLKQQYFTANGIFTVPSGVTSVRVLVGQGGHSGNGGAPGGDSSFGTYVSTSAGGNGDFNVLGIYGSAGYVVCAGNEGLFNGSGGAGGLGIGGRGESFYGGTGGRGGLCAVKVITGLSPGQIIAITVGAGAGSADHGNVMVEWIQ